MVDNIPGLLDSYHLLEAYIAVVAAWLLVEVHASLIDDDADDCGQEDHGESLVGHQWDKQLNNPSVHCKLVMSVIPNKAATKQQQPHV